jgi:hypothetical protein
VLRDTALNGLEVCRILRDTSSIQRGIIRHVYLVIDLSSAMLVRDYKQTWLDLTLQYAQVSSFPFPLQFLRNSSSLLHLTGLRYGILRSKSNRTDGTHDHSRWAGRTFDSFKWSVYIRPIFSRSQLTLFSCNLQVILPIISKLYRTRRN